MEIGCGICCGRGEIIDGGRIGTYKVAHLALGIETFHLVVYSANVRSAASPFNVCIALLQPSHSSTPTQGDRQRRSESLARHKELG